MKLIQEIIFSILFAAYSSQHYKCQYSFIDDDFCLLTNVQVSSENSACKMSFPEGKWILLQNAHFEYLSPLIMHKMSSVEKLDISKSYIERAFIKPELEYLKISGCTLSEVFLDPEEVYHLTDLHLPFNMLERLPQNLNHLRNLTMLDLTSNKLSFLDMSQFNGLTNLQWIQLNDNSLKVILATDSVKLPVLSDLSMSRNDIQILDMSRWEAPLLQKFYISNNSLQELSDTFPKKFPSLRTVSLALNHWNCEWQLRVKRELQQQNCSFEQFDCKKVVQPKTSAKGLKHEQQLKQSMKETIERFVKNATNVGIDLDVIVDNMFCRIYDD